MRQLLCLLALLVCSIVINAQDLFDAKHSDSYISYLYAKEDYNGALGALARWEASGVTQESNFQAARLLVKTGKHAQLHQRINETRSCNEDFFNLVVPYLLLRDSLESASAIMNLPGTQAFAKKEEYRLCYYILSSRYPEADSLLAVSRQIDDTAFYRQLLDDSHHTKTKKAGLPVMMSVIAPASGKYVVGQSYDATVGLLLTGLYGVIAYRAFSLYGTSSVFGWASASLSGLFYISNIAGTYKATARYNDRTRIRNKKLLLTKLAYEI